MKSVSEQLARFRARRNSALSIGIAFPATMMMGAVAGFRTGSLSGAWAFVSVVLAIAGSFYAAWVYRCPHCEREPEAAIPNFRPVACCKCGSRLR